MGGGCQESLSAIVGVRSELAAGDLRPLYLAWLSGLRRVGTRRGCVRRGGRGEVEPPVPAGFGIAHRSRNAPWPIPPPRLRPLEVAAKAGPGCPGEGRRACVATYIAKLPVSDKDRLLMLVAKDQAARARMELLRGLRGDPDDQRVLPAPAGRRRTPRHGRGTPSAPRTACGGHGRRPAGAPGTAACGRAAKAP